MSAVLGAIGAGLQGMSTLGSFFAARDQTSEARRQFDESMRFQRYQYDDMKRYNSPENQVRLMRKAGFNPALMASNLGQSTAVGVSSPSPTASSALPDFSGLSAAGGTLSQLSVMDSEASVNFANATKALLESYEQGITNKYADERNRFFNRGLNFQNDLTYQNYLNAQTLGTLQERTMASQIQQQYYAAETAKAQQGYQVKLLNSFDEEFAARISQIYASAYNAVLSGQASIKQAAAAVMNAQTTKDAMSAQFGSNAKERSDFFKLTMDGLWAAAEKNRSSAWNEWFTNPINYTGAFAPAATEGVRQANKVAHRSPYGTRHYFGNGKLK